VNTAIFTETGGSVGIGFAVPAKKAVRILEELRDKGYVDRAYYTGLQGRTLPERWAQNLGIAQAKGIIVQIVDPESPADDAGFQPYDVIQTFAGNDVDTLEDFAARLYEYRPGDVVEMEVIREGRRISLSMELGSLR
jgi:serine protease Do